MRKKVLLLTVLSLFAVTARAQSGGIFAITQSVVAGGGQEITGGNFSVAGTSGQSSAGTESLANGFFVRGGFWQANFTPTAATAAISGRVSAGSISLPRVLITLTDFTGVSRSTITGSFGYYRFEAVEAGATYIITCNHSRYVFAPQVVTVGAELTEVNFTAATQ